MKVQQASDVPSAVQHLQAGRLEHLPFHLLIVDSSIQGVSSSETVTASNCGLQEVTRRDCETGGSLGGEGESEDERTGEDEGEREDERGREDEREGEEECGTPCARLLKSLLDRPDLLAAFSFPATSAAGEAGAVGAAAVTVAVGGVGAAAVAVAVGGVGAAAGPAGGRAAEGVSVSPFLPLSQEVEERIPADVPADQSQSLPFQAGASQEGAFQGGASQGGASQAGASARREAGWQPRRLIRASGSGGSSSRKAKPLARSDGSSSRKAKPLARSDGSCGSSTFKSIVRRSDSGSKSAFRGLVRGSGSCGSSHLSDLTCGSSCSGSGRSRSQRAETCSVVTGTSVEEWMAEAAGAPPPDQPPLESQQPTFMQPFGEQALEMLDRLCEAKEEVEEEEMEEEEAVRLPVIVVTSGLHSERSW